MKFETPRARGAPKLIRGRSVPAQDFAWIDLGGPAGRHLGGNQRDGQQQGRDFHERDRISWADVE